jgi:class 3 adenylate cyclase
MTAILAADVVGYSRLMGEDEAGTAKAVPERREASTPIVAGHGGRIVKTTGDGLLMKFPSVVAAVECAIAIQKLMVERNAGTHDAKQILYRRQSRRRAGPGRRHCRRRGQYGARLEGICEAGGSLFQAPSSITFAAASTSISSNWP